MESQIFNGVLDSIKSTVRFCVAYANIYTKNFVSGVRYANSDSKKIIYRSYSNEPILVLALFQQGQLRSDIVTLLRQAKWLGFYVVAVNTQQLDKGRIPLELIDLYIERENFGRDFGSYKVAFEEVYSREMDRACERLVMLNDSVYYSSRGLKEFLRALKESRREVVGATENFEIEHHIGSFCISMSGSILRHNSLKYFWKNYQNSDIRPRVIRLGEMALSRTLKSCVRQSDGFGALYSATWFQSRLDQDDQMTNVAMRLCRNSPLVDWPRSTPKGMLEYVTARFLIRKHSLENTTVQVDSDIAEFSSYSPVADYDGLVQILNSRLAFKGSLPKSETKKLINSFFIEMFIRGSQIHQNAAILLHSGLPIIKLDGFYRGMFDGYDLQLIAGLLPEEEREGFVYLMTQKSFGGHALVGWKLLAFNRGLI